MSTDQQEGADAGTERTEGTEGTTEETEGTTEGTERTTEGTEGTTEGTEGTTEGTEGTTEGTEGTTEGTEGTTEGTEGTTEGTEGTTEGTEGTTEGTEGATEGTEGTTDRTEGTTDGAEGTPVDDPPIKLTPEQVEELKRDAQEVFNYVDTDGNGYIEATEIEDLFRSFNHERSFITFSEADLKELGEQYMKLGDENGDGLISFEEFFKALLKESGYEA